MDVRGGASVVFICCIIFQCHSILTSVLHNITNQNDILIPGEVVIMSDTRNVCSIVTVGENTLIFSGKAFIRLVPTATRLLVSERGCGSLLSYGIPAVLTLPPE